MSVSVVEIRPPAKALGHPSRLAPINLDFPIHFGWHWINDMFDEREKPSVNTSITCQLPLTSVWFHFEAGASDTLMRVSLVEMMAGLQKKKKKIFYSLLSHSKPVWLSFSKETQTEILKKNKLLFSMFLQIMWTEVFTVIKNCIYNR